MKGFFSKHGVLGINARNLLYVKPFNPRKATALADDKLKTKAFLTARGIPAAKIYARIENRDQLRAFDFSTIPDGCVLKPNYGFGGEGIIIFRGRTNHGDFKKADGSVMLRKDVIGHIEDILDGKFSLGGRLDTAFFEQILEPHGCFAPFRPVGLPDIRVIVFNLVPVMAMLRIPTATSEGKANLHLGGIGIGIDIAKGVTTHAAQFHKRIAELPHGGSPSGHQIPNWDEILLVCSRIQQITNIGYLAVDITIDETIGPAVLEVNARAGLSVQIANLAPLRSRLERVQGLKVGSPEKGVRLGQDLFGEKVGVPLQSDAKTQKVLGLHEMVTIIGAGESFEEPALIQPDLPESAFAADLLASLSESGAAPAEGGSGTHFRVKFLIGGQKRQTVVTGFFPKAGEPRVRLGRRDISGFLIDPSRESQTKQSAVRSDLRAVEHQLMQLDHEFLTLKALKPVNLEEERARLLEDPRYQPLFQYRELDLEDARHRLEEPVRDHSPLGLLLEKKRVELQHRLDLLGARGHSTQFTKVSGVLFGMPTASLKRAAETMLRNRPECDLPDPTKKFVSTEEAKLQFEEALRRYSLHNWKVDIRPSLIADCTVGGNFIYLKEGARFSPTRIEALILHEIETHILTAENGSHQPYELLQRGIAGYLETQEGLATFNQNRVYGPGNDRRYNPARNVLATAFGLEHSFAETRAFCEEKLGYDADKAITQTISIKRGLRDTSEPGGFTKSLIYFRGWQAIDRFINNGGDLTRLYIGKVSLGDLDLIEQIPDLQPPLLLPEFLRKKTK